jgi:phosphatidylserine decarboxylase
VAGKYHSVNPIALAVCPDVFVENTRQITQLESGKFGSFRYLEVGAFGVGSIIQYTGTGSHLKQSEKGCFKFGGSTVILIFDNAKVKWDSDLLENTAKGYETLIRMGMSIASQKK